MQALSKKELLEWYAEAGVDEAVEDAPRSYWISDTPITEPTAPADNSNAVQMSAAVQSVASARPALHHIPSEAIAQARKAADAADSIDALREAIMAFEGCAIKKTAHKLVFCDGNPESDIMIIDDVPGVDEDKKGVPFSGANGALLDKMLAAIGLSRETTYLANSIFWRPPGNRQASPEEVQICLPFVEKHIALAQPKLLLLMGGTASRTLLQKDTAISRLRGKMHDYKNPYISDNLPTMVSFHPSFLIRSPAQKAHAWQDLLAIKQHIL